MKPPRHNPWSRVLIVQSDPDVCQALRDSLEPEGYRINTIGHGRRAVEYVEVTSCEAVLLDMHLQDIDGISALKTIKEADSTLPVIILTGYYDASTPSHALAAGAFAFMLMPYTSSEVKTVLRDAISIRSLLTSVEQDPCGVMQRTFALSKNIRCTDEAIVLTDDENRILFTNTAAERLFSYDHHEVASKDFRLLLADPYRTGTPADLPLTLIRRPGTTMRQVAQVEGLRKDDSEFPLEISSLNWKINGGAFQIHLLRDMSDDCQDSRPSGDVNIREAALLYVC